MEDSPRSPDPYLYPTTYQPKSIHIPKQINLNLTITNLLTQLKDWLIELCLSEHCVTEVCEQL